MKTSILQINKVSLMDLCCVSVIEEIRHRLQRVEMIEASVIFSCLMLTMRQYGHSEDIEDYLCEH